MKKTPTEILNALSDGRYSDLMMEYIPEDKEKHIHSDRIAHMHGVAELMYRSASNFDYLLLSKEELYLLGLLHDIGYLQGKPEHEENGAWLLSGLLEEGPASLITECINWHGYTPEEYMNAKACGKEDVPQELILLWWADLVIESSGINAGKPVGIRKRLEHIRERYGEESMRYHRATETAQWLLDEMARKLLQNR